MFLNLHAIPFVKRASDDNVVRYNNMAWGLRDKLRKLEVYDFDPVSVKSTERLSHFPNVKKICFHLKI